MKQGRIRTESMVQRFAKKPIAEGYDLWDRDYLLGAMRLFIFKVESAPPFQVGPCIDAIGEILFQMNESQDASEQFLLAAEKYAVLQQPILSQIMRIKAMEAMDGVPPALTQLQTLLTTEDPHQDLGGPDADVRKKSALARAYAYESDLLLKTLTTVPSSPPSGLLTAALASARRGVSFDWDRVHSAYVLLGDALQESGSLSEADAAYQRARDHRPAYLEALLRRIDLAKRRAAPTALLPLLTAAIDVHPKSSLLREKAFVLSEVKGDAAALDFLDPLIQKPPLEEADGAGSQTIGTLLKAKAAILADAGRMKEALEVAERALKEAPADEEAAMIVADIKESME